MKQAFAEQYGHLWRTFARIVRDFRDPFWIESGFCLTTPARLAYHIIESTRYYIADEDPILFLSGASLTARSMELSRDDLPTRDDILNLIDIMAVKTDRWIRSLVIDDKNDAYPWAGSTRGSVALFLIRHGQYHLGEMDALLNEQEKGAARDHFAESVQADAESRS
jgi:hypothetical protein